MPDDKDEAKIGITPTGPKLTPPGYDIELSEADAQTIGEFVKSPAFKILSGVIVDQRSDHIARRALNGSLTLEQLYFYKGMVAELRLLLKTLKGVKKAYETKDKAEDAEMKK